LRKAPPILVLALLGLAGCGLHQPVLINNLDRPGKIDLAANGVLAFQFADPHGLIMTFWACETNTGEKYQLNQDIERLPAAIRESGALTPHGQSRYGLNDTPWVYLYELPPGRYVLRHMHLELDKQHHSLPIRSDTFAVEPGTVTYIGSHALSMTWKGVIRDLWLIPVFTLASSDSSARVEAKLDRVERFGINRLKRRIAVIAIRPDP
jgi:hypothetical protein